MLNSYQSKRCYSRKEIHLLTHRRANFKSYCKSGFTNCQYIMHSFTIVHHIMYLGPLGKTAKIDCIKRTKYKNVILLFSFLKPIRPFLFY
jgi:hypothetical protein